MSVARGGLCVGACVRAINLTAVIRNHQGYTGPDGGSCVACEAGKLLGQHLALSGLLSCLRVSVCVRVYVYVHVRVYPRAGMCVCMCVCPRTSGLCADAGFREASP